MRKSILSIFIILLLMASTAFAADDSIQIVFQDTYAEFPNEQIMKIYIDKPTILDMDDAIIQLTIQDGMAVFEDNKSVRIDSLGDINDDISLTYSIFLKDDTSKFYEGVKVFATLNYSYTVGLRFKKMATAEGSFLGLWPNHMDIQKYIDDLEDCEKGLDNLEDKFTDKVMDLADKNKINEELQSKNKEFMDTLSIIEAQNVNLINERSELKRNNSELIVRNHNLNKKAMNVLFYKMIAGTGVLLSILLIILFISLFLQKNYTMIFEHPMKLLKKFTSRRPKKTEHKKHVSHKHEFNPVHKVNRYVEIKDKE